MDLIQLLIVLVVVGLLLWLVTSVVPLPQPVRTIVVVVVTLVACFWLLSWAGLTHPLVFRR
jgi:hypothetical protein